VSESIPPRADMTPTKPKAGAARSHGDLRDLHGMSCSRLRDDAAQSVNGGKRRGWNTFAGFLFGVSPECFAAYSAPLADPLLYFSIMNAGRREIRVFGKNARVLDSASRSNKFPPPPYRPTAAGRCLLCGVSVSCAPELGQDRRMRGPGFCEHRGEP